MPVAASFLMNGQIEGQKPKAHDLTTEYDCLQMLGMHGTVFANFAVDQSDLLLAFGVRFDDRVTGKLETFASNAKIVHIDIDPAELNKNKDSFITVTGEPPHLPV